VKAVRCDAYKITEFLRFREASGSHGAHFIAWYEPEHYTLELSVDFFKTPFRNMTWSILTPYLAAHWDQEDLVFQVNPDVSQYLKDDEVETYWLKYYATTFNPARPKKQAMLNQMPKKYWKNMPETSLINDMLRHADACTRTMLDTDKSL
jgi:probable DNA metabolism protein